MLTLTFSFGRLAAPHCLPYTSKRGASSDLSICLNLAGVAWHLDGMLKKTYGPEPLDREPPQGKVFYITVAEYKRLGYPEELVAKLDDAREIEVTWSGPGKGLAIRLRPLSK